jgi:anthraniloyl-CoA monooxygenase
MQLGHAGAKGSTRVPWEGEDLPLVQGNWPLLSASPMQYLDGVSDWARAMTRDDMTRVTADFVASTQRAIDAGFDWLELHCAHGYLLSAFLSPLTNQRTDEYGGSLENRMRWPLEVFRAMRALWPQGQALLGAHLGPRLGRGRQHAGRRDRDRACLQAGRRRPRRRVLGPGEQGAAAGVWPHVPDAVRRRDPQRGGHRDDGGGRDLRADHVNSIVAAGRADLCAIARPHLASPSWTLLEAAKIGHTSGIGADWPKQYLSGKSQLERNLEREKALAAQNAGLTPHEQANLAQGV